MNIGDGVSMTRSVPAILPHKMMNIIFTAGRNVAWGLFIYFSAQQYKWDKDFPTKADCFCDMASMGGTLRSPGWSVNRFHRVRKLGIRSRVCRNFVFSAIVVPTNVLRMRERPRAGGMGG